MLETSIIICTYNRSLLLKRALEALSVQTLDDTQYEVIIIDDGSLDNTEQVCSEWSTRLNNFVYHRLPKNMGLATARNYAIRIARGTKMLFTDDDCIPQPDWAEKLSQSLDLHPAVTGGIISRTDNYLTLANNMVHFNRAMAFRKQRKFGFAVGANMGFLRSVVDESSGFNEEIPTCEDMEFGLRIQESGHALYFDPASAVIHDPPIQTFSQILKYSFAHAKVSIQLRNRYSTVLKTPAVLRYPITLLLASPLIAIKSTFDSIRGCPATFRYLSTIPVIFLSRIAWCLGASLGIASNTDTLSR